MRSQRVEHDQSTEQQQQRRNQSRNEKKIKINKNENTTYQNPCDVAKVVLKREVCSNTGISQTRKISNSLTI